MGLLTNESSMVALNTLRQINKGLTMVQQEISTGKSVSNSRDNAAIWAVSTVMQSDVDGFEAISSSLDLGASTVGVARGAAESVTELLQDMKGLIVSAQEDNVDRTKIQTDIDQLEAQITTIVDAAQFNGLNLLKGTDAVTILSSLNRAADGTVSTSDITVNRTDLSISGGEALALTGGITASATAAAGSGGSAAVDGTLDVTIAGTIVAGEDFTVTIGGDATTFTAATTSAADVAAGLQAAIDAKITAGDAGYAGLTVSAAAGVLTIDNSNNSAVSIAVSTDSAAGTIATAGSATQVDAQTPAVPNTTAGTADITISGSVTAGELYTVSVDGTSYNYRAYSGDSLNEVAAGLNTLLGNAELPTNVTASVSGDTLTFSNLSDTAVALTGSVTAATTSSLAGVSDIDVTTSEGATAALTTIENLIDVGIDAAAAFGSSQKRIDIQNDFVKTLTDSLKSGIGALVEADLEEASARLQSLQVQQQLGVQALSIANQRPQTLLGLFR